MIMIVSMVVIQSVSGIPCNDMFDMCNVIVISTFRIRRETSNDAKALSYDSDELVLFR